MTFFARWPRRVFTRPLGLGLITVRAALAAKPEETYKALGAAGITELEVRPAHLTGHRW